MIHALVTKYGSKHTCIFTHSFLEGANKPRSLGIRATRFNLLVPVDKPLREYCRKWSNRPNPDAHIRVTDEERAILERRQ